MGIFQSVGPNITNIVIGKNEFKVSDNEEDEIIVASRLQVLAGALHTPEDFVGAYDDTRQIVETFNKQFKEKAEDMPQYLGYRKPEMYAFSVFYPYFEHYSFIEGVAAQNILIS